MVKRVKTTYTYRAPQYDPDDPELLLISEHVLVRTWYDDNSSSEKHVDVKDDSDRKNRVVMH